MKSLGLNQVREARQSVTQHVIRVYDAAGNVIGTHEEAGDFKEW
jgi:hypothetical protein